MQVVDRSTREPVAFALGYVAVDGTAALVRLHDLVVLGVVGEDPVETRRFADAVAAFDEDEAVAGVTVRGGFVIGRVGTDHAIVFEPGDARLDPREVVERVHRACRVLDRLLLRHGPGSLVPPPAAGDGGTPAPAEARVFLPWRGKRGGS